MNAQIVETRPMLGEVLRLLRIANDKSMSTLAQDMKISTSCISLIEADRKAPTLHVLEKYSAALDIPIPTILAFEEGRKHNNYDYQQLLLRILELSIETRQEVK